MVEGFQRQNGRPFTQRQTVALSVERPALRGGKRLERIEAGEDQLAQRIVTAGEDALGKPGADQRGGVPNGVGAGSAGVADDRHRTAEAKGLAQFQGLALRLILHHARRLLAVAEGFADCLAKIIFPHSHPAAGRAEHHRQIFRRRPSGLLPGLVRRVQQQPARPIQPALLARGQSAPRQARREIHLGRAFHPLPGNVEQGDGTKSGPPATKAQRVRFPAVAQGGNNANSGDDHAERVRAALWDWKKH